MTTCGFWYRNEATRQKTQLPLKSIDVNVTINGFIAHVSSALKYKNNLDKPIEAVFSFPIDENSAIYRFEAEIQGRKIIAECQEKQQAKQTYDDAIAEGRTALLLEEDRESGDIFTCTVGNLPPEAEAEVTFCYVQELPLTIEGTAVEFTLPCLFVPRYRPDHAPQRTDLPAAASPSAIPYSLTFNATLTGPKVRKVTSETEKISVNYGDAETKVTLAQDFRFENDLKLRVEYEDAFKPTVAIQKGNKEKSGILREEVVMLNFMPELKDGDFSGQHEFIFIIDRSGSMSGSNIRNAGDTLLLLLKSLPAGSYFNVCSFGSGFDFLFPKSREYSEDSLKAALELQKGLDATYGGTEILRPLQEIYSKPLLPTHTRQLLLLTDGQVSNTHDVIALVKKNANNARMFSIGIGSGASTSLVKGIARAGNGRAEFVQGADRLQAKVMKIMRQAMQAVVRDLACDWSIPPEVKVTLIPQKVPAIFSGDKLIMYAILKGVSDDLHGSVTLRGSVDQRPLEFELPLSRATVMADDNSRPLHRLAAKAQIKLLEDQEVSETAEVDSEVFGKMTNKDLIVMLSTSANIVSRHTSFVGVDKRGERVKGPPVQQRVPVPQDVPQFRCMSSATHILRLQNTLGVRDTMRMNVDSVLERGDRLSELIDRADCNMYGPEAVYNCLAVYEDDDVYEEPVYCDYGESWDEDATYDDVAVYDDGDVYDDVYCSAPIPVRHKAKPCPPAYTCTLPIEKPDAEKIARRDIVGMVTLQGFHGNWELDQSLADILGKSLAELKAAADKLDPKVWATILALAWLQENFAANKDEWLMIEAKAHAWLSANELQGSTKEDLIVKARQLNLKI